MTIISTPSIVSNNYTNSRFTIPKSEFDDGNKTIKGKKINNKNIIIQENADVIRPNDKYPLIFLRVKSNKYD